MEQQIKEMNIISEPDIKIEDIKIEDDWSFEWVADLELNHQNLMPQLQDYKPCSAERNPMNEPIMKIIVPTVKLRQAYEVCNCKKNKLPFTRAKAKNRRNFVMYLNNR